MLRRGEPKTFSGKLRCGCGHNDVAAHMKVNSLESWKCEAPMCLQMIVDTLSMWLDPFASVALVTKKHQRTSAQH